jgi:hypothetical protein
MLKMFDEEKFRKIIEAMYRIKYDMVKEILPTRLCEVKKALGIERYHNLDCGRLQENKSYGRCFKCLNKK